MAAAVRRKSIGEEWANHLNAQKDAGIQKLITEEAKKATQQTPRPDCVKVPVPSALGFSDFMLRDGKDWMRVVEWAKSIGLTVRKHIVCDDDDHTTDAKCHDGCEEAEDECTTDHVCDCYYNSIEITPIFPAAK